MLLGRYIIILLLVIVSVYSEAQSINTEFGKNRVQFHNDFVNWSQYETENFVTYWYGKSRRIAQPVIQLAEFDHDEIQRLLEHTLSDKIEVIVYIDLTDLKQSNIGLEEAFNNTEGVTKIQGNKMFVHFDGDHLNLRKQIRQGITQVYINSILTGSSIQEIVQNAFLLNLPNWFVEGLSAYGRSSWDHEIDDELRELLSHKEKYYSFKKLAKDHPRVAGHSMWHYIAETYGGSTIANIIYLTRIHRNLENSFLFITGEPFDYLKEEWKTYYKNRYRLEEGRFTEVGELQEIKLKNKKGVPVSNMKLSPDCRQLLYVSNVKGKYKIYLRDLATDQEKLIFKKGHKNIFQETDYNYPLISWHPTRNQVTILYEHRDHKTLRRIYLSSGEYEEQELTEDFQRIYSMDYLNDTDYIFSASKDGYSDLYIYMTKTRGSVRLTHDYFDDLDAQVVSYNGKRSILFSSNRTNTDATEQLLDTILPIDHFDIYVYQGLERKSDKKIIQLTDTKNYSERQPIMLQDNRLLYLTEKSGINNAYVKDLSNGDIAAQTNISRNIIIHNTNKDADKFFYMLYDEGKYKIFDEVIDYSSSLGTNNTVYRTLDNGKKSDSDITIPMLPEENKEAVSKEITEAIMFQSEFDDPDNLIDLDEYVDKEETSTVFDKYFSNYFSESIQDGKRVIKYSPMRASASRIKFRLADFTTKMDNSVLFEGLESYAGEDKELTNVPAGILFKGTVKDLLEDYQVQVGLRIPTSFNGYEYFFTLDNNKHLWDKRIAFYRKAETNIIDPTVFPVQRERRHTFLGLYRLKYPLDIYTSFRLTGSLRFDKYLRLITDANSIETPPVNEKRLSLKAEFVFDNSFDVSTNIKNGTRLKFYAEGINDFIFDLNDGLNADLSTGFTTVFGFDARHYIPILKDAVLALRGSGATSFGNKRIIYYLGGMENWLFSKYDDSVPVPQSDNFSYKALAPHLRGFSNNIRNGNSYLLSNAEIRIPLFRMLGLRKRGVSFFRNFQVTGFFDAGLAWYGLGPNDDPNLLNNITLRNPEDNPVITVDARYFRDPLVMGYGFGLRSTLLGYFVKFDYAWGIETRQVQKPRFYFSLGKDF